MTLVSIRAVHTTMKTLHLIALLFIAALCHRSSLAQSKITIASADSLPFIATWNTTVLNQTPVYSITFREDNVGKIPVLMSFPTRSEITIQQTLVIKPNMAVVFEVSMIKGTYKLVPASENTYAFVNSTLPVAAPPATSNLDAVSSTDSLQTGASASQEAYEQLKTAIAQQTFESRKLALIQTYLQNESINIDQLRYLMAQLSLEDRKLELLKMAIPKVQDKSRLHEVADEFLLDKNKEKAKEMVAQ